MSTATTDRQRQALKRLRRARIRKLVATGFTLRDAPETSRNEHFTLGESSES